MNSCLRIFLNDASGVFLIITRGSLRHKRGRRSRNSRDFSTFSPFHERMPNLRLCPFPHVRRVRGSPR